VKLANQELKSLKRKRPNMDKVKIKKLLEEMEESLRGENPSVNVFKYFECLKLLAEHVLNKKKPRGMNGNRKKTVQR
jgi:hypothetical protein